LSVLERHDRLVADGHEQVLVIARVGVGLRAAKYHCAEAFESSSKRHGDRLTATVHHDELP